MEASSPITMHPNQNILLAEHRKITKITEMKGKLLGGFFVLLCIHGMPEFMLFIQPVSILSSLGSMIKLDI